MILDARTIHDVPRPGTIVGFRGIVGSLLIHVTLLTTVLSYDAYLRARDRALAGLDAETTSAANAAGDPTAPTTGSAAVVRAGQLGVESEQSIELPSSLAGLASADLRQRIVERLRMALTFGTLIDHLWQSTAFAVAAALLTLAFRRHRARVRYWLWFSASIKFLVPFTPIVVLGSQIAWPAAIRSIANHPIVAGIGEPLINVDASVAAMLPALPSAASGAQDRHWLGLALLVIWASGFVAILWSRFRAWRQLRALVAASQPMELPGVEIPADVAVRSAPGLLEPGVIGWQRPILLMPADIAQHLDPQEIAAIVAHELCHVRRQDNLTAAFHMIAEALFWFHPAVWWIGARLVDERERACDEHVLQTVGQPRSYAQGILNICKRYAASPLASVAGVSSSNVKKRIDAILANHIGEAIGPWQKVILATTIALVLIVPLGAGAIYAPRFAGQVSGSSFTSRTNGVARPAAHEMMFRAAAARSVDGSGPPASTIAYALVVAGPDRRLGPRMTASEVTDCNAAEATGRRCGIGVAKAGEISAYSLTPTEMAGLISIVTERQVEDRTGLTGRFTFQLTWASGPAELSVFTAVREQLGLTLVPIGVVQPVPQVGEPTP